MIEEQGRLIISSTISVVRIQFYFMYDFTFHVVLSNPAFFLFVNLKFYDYENIPPYV